MRRLLFALLFVLGSCAPPPAFAQFDLGAGSAPKIAGAALPACTAETISDYMIVDSDDPDSCSGGSGTLYSGVNYCYCDQDDLNWKVLASSLDEVALEALLASTANGQGASKIGVEDAASRFISTDLEGVLAELHSLASAGGGGGGGATSEAQLETNLLDVANVFTNNDGTLADDDLSDDSTSDLAEGTNLYYTDGRADARVGIHAASADHDGRYFTETEVQAGPCNSTTEKQIGVDTDGSPVCATDQTGGGGATNLGTTVAADQVTVTNDTGTPAVLPQATPTTAGVISGADQAKLDGIEAAATADQTGAEILSAFESETGRDVSADGAKLDSIGLQTDSDADGLYEVAYLWDADGDGSGKVTCTAKDVPDPACKASGEVIYRDFADDLNCAIHGGCPGTGQMEQTGLLLLEDGVVYAIWPCWDASEPAGFNDPTAANDDLHDSTADTAYNHCPATPSGTGRRFITVALLGWQGTLQGAGVDTRDPETTAGYVRDQGTYIVDDRGPAHDGDGDNVWFLSDGFIRGINFGYQNSINSVPSVPTQTGEFGADGDSKGYGEISGNQPILGFNGAICVADTSTGGSVSADGWAQALMAGDLVMIPTSSMGTDELNMKNIYRVRDTPSATTCNGAGTVEIPLGGRVSSGTGGDFSGNIAYSRQAYDGRFVIAVRSDHLQSAATIRQVTIEPQDWWNETGGDCAGSGVWDSTADSAQADHDCDTNPLVGFWGHTNSKLEEVVIRHWHDRAIDGEAGSGYRGVEDSQFFFGNGGQLSDPSQDFRFKQIFLAYSQFEGGIFGTFGGNLSVQDLTIFQSSFDYIATFQDSAVGQRFERVKILASAFGHAFRYLCGARNNVVSDVTITGHEDSNAYDLNGALARMICADTAEPIQGNSIDLVHMEGPGQATGGTGATNCAVVMDANSVIGTSNAGAIQNNQFSRIHYVESGDAINVSPSLFCIQDDEVTTSRDVGPDYSHEEVLADNQFWGSSIELAGGSGTARVYATCGLFDAGGNGSTHRCEDGLNGSGSNGADPVGCMNFENGAVPAVQSCQ